MPRAFTTTIRTYDFRTAAILDAHSVFYDEADLNVQFWNHAFSSLEVEFGIRDFFSPDDLEGLLTEFCGFFEAFYEKYAIPLTPLGFALEEVFPSSGDIVSATQLPEFQLLVDEFLETLLPGLNLDDPTLEVVSLGVVSADSLIFACLFAEALRDHLPRGVKLILGKHSYENFSLSLRNAELQNGGALGKVFRRGLIP